MKKYGVVNYPIKIIDEKVMNDINDKRKKEKDMK